MDRFVPSAPQFVYKIRPFVTALLRAGRQRQLRSGRPEHYAGKREPGRVSRSVPASLGTGLFFRSAVALWGGDHPALTDSMDPFGDPVDTRRARRMVIANGSST